MALLIYEFAENAERKNIKKPDQSRKTGQVFLLLFFKEICIMELLDFLICLKLFTAERKGRRERKIHKTVVALLLYRFEC